MDHLVIISLVAILLTPYLLNLLSAYGKLLQWLINSINRWTKRDDLYK